jgi:hypothetical protein
MRAVASIAVVVGLVVLAGRASLGTGSEKVQTSQWTLYPGFQGLGLHVKRDIPLTYSGPAEIVVTASPDVDLALAGKVCECSGPVLIEHFGESGNSFFAVRIATSRDYAFRVGKSSFTAPAGALVTFLREAVAMVVFPKDTDATLNGASDTIPAGWGISFDAEGNGTKGKVE